MKEDKTQSIRRMVLMAILFMPTGCGSSISEVVVEVAKNDASAIELSKEDLPPINVDDFKLVWSHNEGSLSKGETLQIISSQDIKNSVLNICFLSKKLPAINLLNFPVTRKLEGKGWCEKAIVESQEKNKPILVNNYNSHQVWIQSLEINEQKLLQKKQTKVLSKPIYDTIFKQEEVTVTKANDVAPWLLEHQKKLPSIQFGEYNQLSLLNDFVLAKNNIPHECSPLEPFLQNESLASSVDTCKKVFQPTDETSICFPNVWVAWNAATEPDWSQVTIRLKENRICQSNELQAFSWWVYPKDQVSVNFQDKKGNYTIVSVDGINLGEGKWSLKILSSGDELFSSTISNFEGKQTFLLNKPTKEDSQLQIKISSLEGDGFLYIEQILLAN